jgi:hypothetical protein
MPDTDNGTANSDNPNVTKQSQAAGGPAIPAKDSETASWVDTLPEPLKANKALAKFKDHIGLAQSYLELEGQLGKSVVLPGKDAKPEEWDKFYARLGRPNKPEEFQLEALEGFEAPETYLSRLKAIFHAAGLSPGQANAIHKAIAQDAMVTMTEASKAQEVAAAQAVEAQAQKREQAEKSLRNAWGFDYDLRMEQARRFVLANAGDQGFNYLEKIGVASDPIILQLFANAGAATGNHKFVSGNGGPVKPPDRYDWMREKYGQR